MNSIIMEEDDIIETSTEEVVISEDDEHQRNKFYTDVEKYKNSLSLCMREKSMITMVLYNNIINALKQTKGGKKLGIDSRFHTWCKTYFRIDVSAGIELLISSKNSNRVVVVEHFYQVSHFAFV